jgi:broad specificity phosphatase PhoE
MGQILLVRHGQASFGADDYDVLSPVGEEQAAVLGEFLVGLKPDVVVHGTLKRQQRTAEIAAQSAGWQAELRTDERWNEIDHLAITATHPKHFEGEPDARQFQEWFERATARWASGEYDEDYTESFVEFRERSAAALDDLLDAGTAVVFTSGGPIAALTTQLLEAGTPTYHRLAAVVVNASITKVVTGRRGTTLVSFNAHGHFEGRDGLLTYR